MEISNETGLLSLACQFASAHFSERPDPNDISLLVIHCISLPPGQFGGREIHDLFMGQLDCDAHEYFEQLRGLEVSSHLVISRDGSVEQYVPFHLMAWHAGKSEFNGRQRCNDFSIGIELEGTETETYTDAQYRSLSRVTKCLLDHYPAINPERIVGHSDIAPVRKTDPGQFFDWERYMRMLESEDVDHD
ncbi:1,6-anhydro-N-acetylmuramyl-L-alanine amidase AmpD [Pelagibaculum spongiae]|uniref:1,6-anhydro-N-acetylmuramyl-L-alanine amidase AmpD n=1 Tax=Pelagibaculum spongiae TaxID=2080658 RepID=A0A2V1H737_9GAMM|nr:1,6-anhydro-N-acetylmuramyl-L-alanine amidase AmpD [Pelagibaculum spongiae]PVZ72595.1 1,6-anhydro-N-acetylmuramyl-L-alanine amidase AmpD [Pelagibaculum spongiae]